MRETDAPDGAETPWEPEDPMSLHGSRVDGDPEVMLACLVEEYARMGWDAARIEQLFARPFFQATHQLYQRYGPEGIRTRVHAVLGRCGVQRSRTTVRRPDAAEGEALHV